MYSWYIADSLQSEEYIPLMIAGCILYVYVCISRANNSLLTADRTACVKVRTQKSD